MGKTEWLLGRWFTVVIALSVILSITVVLVHLIIATRVIPRVWSFFKECFKSHDYMLVSQEEYDSAAQEQETQGRGGQAPPGERNEDTEEPAATGETDVAHTRDYIDRMGGLLVLANYFTRSIICAVEVILTIVVFAQSSAHSHCSNGAIETSRRKHKHKKHKDKDDVWKKEDWLDVTLLIYWTWILLLTLSMFKLRRKLRGIVARHLIVLGLVFAIAFTATAIWPTAALDIRSPSLSSIDWLRGILGIALSALAFVDWSDAFGHRTAVDREGS